MKTSATSWNETQRLIPIDTIVSGVVTKHKPFGFFVKIDGIPFDGLVQITDLKDEGKVSSDDFPPVGSVLKARVLGYKESGKQIWLGVKPSQFF